MKGSEAKVKTYPRQNYYKQKVWNESRPFYQKKAQSKRKLVRTNNRGHIRV